MNISIIGMMGAGKTTVGKLLVEKLSGFSLIDTDDLIIKRENKTINEIFNENGEEYFRKVETDIIREIFINDNQIISTGGGIICSDENLEILKGNSLVFYLKANDTTLFERVKNNKERPLLNVDKIHEKIISLLEQRKTNYEKAHFIIETDNKSTNEVVNSIIGIINDCYRG